MSIMTTEQLQREGRLQAVESAPINDASDEAEYRRAELSNLMAYVDEVIRSLPPEDGEPHQVQLTSAALAAAFSTAVDLVGGVERISAEQGVVAKFDALESLLHQLQYFCSFADELPRSLSEGKRSGHHQPMIKLRAESLFMMFGMLCDRLDRARSELHLIRTTVLGALPGAGSKAA